MINSKTLNNFSQDKFHREEFADYLTRFIETRTSLPVNDNSLVIGLDSAWGTGKSSFIQMWMTKLLEDDKPFNIITYNAWEHDDSIDALIPIICSFSQLSGKDKVGAANMRKRVTTLLVDMGVTAANHIIKSKTGIDVKGELNTLVTDATLSEAIYDEYTSLQKKKDTLKTFVSKYSSADRPLLIFIDELDRCRPTFAIETLEAVKHFFDLSNVVFVLSLDMGELQNSIKVIYGDINATGYIQRFFDYQISLPRPQSYDEYLSDILVSGSKILEDEIMFLSDLAGGWNLSIRDLTVISMAYLKFYEARTLVYNIERNDNWLVFLYFIARKYSDYLKYIEEINSGVKIDSRHVARDIFVYPEFSQKYESMYTKEIAESNAYMLHYFNENPKTNNHRWICKLFDERELSALISYEANNTVAQALMNIIDYGYVYPENIRS